MTIIAFVLLLRRSTTVNNAAAASFSSYPSSSLLISTTAAARRRRHHYLTSSFVTLSHPLQMSKQSQQEPPSSQYWNREEAALALTKRTSKDGTKESTSHALPIVKEARIVSLSSTDDNANRALHYENGINLPNGATLLAIGSSVQEFNVSLEELQEQQPNVMFVSHPLARRPLAELLSVLPSIEWIHMRSAGIDFVTSNTLSDFRGVVTNAKGHFSSTLAEYTMLACSYFAKNVPRLLQQQCNKQWNKYNVLELRGSTIGIVGYGDIGRAIAKLAGKRGYGMNVIALKRDPTKPTADDDDDLVDTMYASTPTNLNKLFAKCDYVVCSAPLTKETKGMIGKEQFQHAKQGCVFINVGRGAIVDEDALVEALQPQPSDDGTSLLKGAALDVFAHEPLPSSSPLWELPNVLLSPHNMDQTATFMHEATEFFVNENLPRFLHGQPLLNPVNPSAGY